MNIKMASGEDFTITTKGGYTLTAPDKTGTLATSGDITPVVTSLSSSNTDSEIPSAKCVYDMIGDVESALNALL